VARETLDGFDAGVRALARRELSVTELVDRIRRSGVSEDDARRAAARLREAGYQSDERAARERARVLAERGLGDRGIEDDLRQRGLASTLRASVIAELPPERERAERVVLRRGNGDAALGLLLRKGFDEEVARAVSRSAVADGP
jgi:SOS response regulatory protein OraA/RecX